MNTRQYLVTAITEIMRAESRIRCGSRQSVVNALCEAKSNVQHALELLEKKRIDVKPATTSDADEPEKKPESGNED